MNCYLFVLNLYLKSWDLYSTSFKEVVGNTKFIVADGSSRRQSAEFALKNLEGRILQDTFDENALPNVICPWGCWESVERCNHLSFELFLALIDPRLRSNNHRETKLRGVHPLFPQGYTLLNKFEVRPIALITSNGSFVILTCAHHNGDQ